VKALAASKNDDTKNGPKSNFFDPQAIGFD
jgi:predicted RNA-binding protein with PUA-like domain